MLYISFIGTTLYGHRELLDMYVDSESPQKQNDVEVIKEKVKDKHNRFVQVTILNWKELDD